MRRIYESSAIKRDQDDPFSPGKRDGSETPQAMRSVPSRMLSHALVPRSLRHYAISVSVHSPEATYSAKTRIPFTLVMRNAMPFPITLETDSPLVWTWDVNGVAEASHVPLRELDDDDTGALQFSRGERKTITRNWDQTFRVSDSEWERASPGEYTIGAGVNLAEAKEQGLYDQTTVTIQPE